jgi:Tol biopolymer transport system component
LNGAPQLLAQDSFGITDVTVSPDGRHAIYVQDRPDVNLWTLKLATAHPTPELADSLSSTRSEFDPQYSADGRMVAFQSDRSGNPEIWAGARDGSDLKQLTHFEGPETGAPYWSPDGKSITFHSRVEGLATIFVVPTAGGTPRAISPKDFASELPSWSHDGKWIYFTSSRSGRMEIWRMRPDGGGPEQITRNGGYAAIDSMDSRFVYYAKSRNQDDGLWRLSLETGEDVRVLPRVLERAFGITRDAIYYGYLIDGFTRTAIEKLPYGATKPVRLAIFPKPIVMGFAVRPDESELTLGQLDTHTSQLMMMNFVQQ